MTRALLTYTGGCKQLLGWEEGLTVILCALTTSFLNCWGTGTCEKSLTPESAQAMWGFVHSALGSGVLGTCMRGWEKQVTLCPESC